MLRAVRVENKGLRLRSILELCHGPGTRRQALTECRPRGNASIQAVDAEPAEEDPAREARMLFLLHIHFLGD